MRISFDVNHDESYYKVKWQGRINNVDLVNAYRSFFESREWVPGYDSFVDLSEFDASNITANGVLSLASLVKETFASHNINPKIAVYAPQDLPYGLSRQYSVGVDSIESHEVFRDKNEALKWLKRSK